MFLVAFNNLFFLSLVQETASQVINNKLYFKKKRGEATFLFKN